MKKLILTTCLTLLLSVNAQANYFNDGNKLLSDMEENVNTSRMYALGYVAGVVDSLNQVVFCLPSTVTVGQLNDMVHNYLNNVPADRHLAADVIIAKVLAASFPCAKGGNV